MFLPLLLLACDAEPEETAAPEPATIVFLSPTDGATVPGGDVDFSVLVENFTLVDLAKHGGESVPEGYIAVRVDGAEVLQARATQFTIALEPGAVDVEAELTYEDGDSLDEPAIATLSLTVE
ncbi:MAG: hypothetical protein Q8P41_25500 [Pseudomonadota bacterium]|nr:hypothetical protein [Pseudomonadota bacterium]